MRQMEIKKLLKDSLTMEAELVEFIDQCLEHVFPDDWVIGRNNESKE